MSYIRDDVYFCHECGQFHDLITDKVVNIPYSEMPAEFALEVMKIRHGVLKRHPKTKHKRGFGKQR